MITAAWEDLRVGDRTTSEFTEVTQADVEAFAELTGDRHPLHMDAAYAAQTRFGRNIAHGAYMMSTFLGLAQLHPSWLQCFYGIDRVRFLGPTYFGDRVRAQTEVVDIRPRSDGKTAVVTCHGELWNDRDEKVFEGDFALLTAGREVEIPWPLPAADAGAREDS